MWEPRRLTTLWASMACYRDSFTFLHLTETINILKVLIDVREMYFHWFYHVIEAFRSSGKRFLAWKGSITQGINYLLSQEQFWESVNNQTNKQMTYNILIEIQVLGYTAQIFTILIHCANILYKKVARRLLKFHINAFQTL
jgi:hypothetical protein